MQSKSFEQDILFLNYQNEELNIKQPIYRIHQMKLKWDHQEYDLNKLYLQLLDKPILVKHKLLCISLFNLEVSIQLYGPEQVINDWFAYIKKCSFQIDVYRNYRVIKQLGEGKFGNHYKVMNKKTKQKYVLKVIKNIDDNGMREIEILRELNIDQCIQLHEIYKEKGNIYLVVDYIGGGEILSFLQQQRQKLEEQNIRDIFIDLFQGLQYIHSKGIIHRDIVPKNLLRRSNRDNIEIVIADFSHAVKGIDDKIGGTPGYIAPEILKNQPYNNKVDIYSIGVILHLLFTGCFPQEVRSMRSIVLGEEIQSQLSQNNVSREGISFITHCLQEDPNKRMSATEALEHPWITTKSLKSGFSLNSSSSLYNITLNKSKQGCLTNQGSLDQIDFSQFEDSDDEQESSLTAIRSYQIIPKFRVE